jgi:hypothetical protein
VLQFRRAGGAHLIYIYKNIGEDAQVAGIKKSNTRIILGNFWSILAYRLMLVFCPIRQSISLACLWVSLFAL